MILKNKKALILSSLLILLPIPVGLLLWNRFPETMAVHWGITGQADGFASVPWAVFVPPLSLLAAHWLCIVFTSLDKGNRDRNQKMQKIVLWIIPIIGNLCCGGMYALALGWEFSPVFWTVVPMGLMFAVIGNFLPKTRMNSTIGIKVVWAYSSEANWNATHRLAGKLWAVGGILVALGGFLPHIWAVVWMFTLLMGMCIIPIVYSYRFYKKELAEGKCLKKGYSSVDKKVMKGSAVFLVLLTVFVVFVMFFGDIDYEFQADHLLVKADMYTDYVLPYDRIEAMEYREGNVPGLRVGGFGSARLLMGHFENEEFGTYIRYTYTKPGASVVVRLQKRVLVLSCEDEAGTRELYETLLEKTR